MARARGARPHAAEQGARHRRSLGRGAHGPRLLLRNPEVRTVHPEPVEGLRQARPERYSRHPEAESIAGCRTWTSPAAHRPQRPMVGFSALRVHRLPAQWLGYWAANPAKTGLAGADARHRHARSDSLLAGGLGRSGRACRGRSQLLSGPAPAAIRPWAGASGAGRTVARRAVRSGRPASRAPTAADRAASRTARAPAAACR